MNLSPRLLAGLFGWLLITAYLSADEPVPLGKLLTPDEFRQAGLNKLSPQEIASLEAALARHQAPPALGASPVTATNNAPAASESALTPGHPPAATPASRPAAEAFGAEQIEPAKTLVAEKELASQIEGTLENLTGRSVFVLQNGQVWQQRVSDVATFTPPLKNPRVVISRGLLGYKMVIPEINRVIYVRRLQ